MNYFEWLLLANLIILPGAIFICYNRIKRLSFEYFQLFNKIRNISIDNYTITFLEDLAEYRINGELHRTDGPAKEYSNGSAEWYSNNMLHRIDGPARIHKNEYGSTEEWYIVGKLHRINGPAVVKKDINGTILKETWYFNGLKNREYGPASYTKDGSQIHWYRDDKLHCWDKPAIFMKKINDYGIYETIEEWYRDGIKLENGHKVENPNHGNLEEWHLDGEIHRLDGPAIIESDGTKKWYIKNQELDKNEFSIKTHGPYYDPIIWIIPNTEMYHREYGPAYITPLEYEWWNFGQRHRIDGPACSCYDHKSYTWWLNGKKYTYDEYFKELINQGYINEIEWLNAGYRVPPPILEIQSRYPNIEKSI